MTTGGAVAIAGYAISATIAAFLPTTKYTNKITGEICPVFIQHSASAASWEYTTLAHCRLYWVFGFWCWIFLPALMFAAIIVKCFTNGD